MQQIYRIIVILLCSIPSAFLATNLPTKASENPYLIQPTSTPAMSSNPYLITPSNKTEIADTRKFEIDPIVEETKVKMTGVRLTTCTTSCAPCKKVDREIIPWLKASGWSVGTNELDDCQIIDLPTISETVPKWEKFKDGKVVDTVFGGMNKNQFSKWYAGK